MDTHYYGTLNVVRAFAPVLAADGGAILKVLSALSWFSYDGANAYSAAKAAEWSLTNGIRLELAGQGTLVTGPRGSAGAGTTTSPVLGGRRSAETARSSHTQNTSK